MPKHPVFAVLRFDGYVADPEHAVTVVKVVPTQAAAEAETARLNDLNGDSECRYVWRTTRLVTDE